MTPGLAQPGTRVVLVGTGTHVPGSPLPDVPAVAGTVHDLGRALIRHGGLAPANLTTVVDPENMIDFAKAVTRAALQAEDTLLLYYVGHGLVSPAGELHLAVRTTDSLSEELSYKALPYSTIRDALAVSRARSIVVVLDCCFSGRADAVPGSAARDAASLAYVRGSYLLTSASGEEVALAPPGAAHTAFTGCLLDLLEAGDPSGPPELTLDAAFRHLHRALPEQNRPRPHRQAADRAGELVLAPNRAYRPPVRPERGAETPADADAVCPYRGLQRFGEQDADYFFGRSRLTSQLLQQFAGRLSGAGPLVVVGPSGSGKSSVLRAGLLAAVDRGELPQPEARAWPQRVITPGPDPLQRLAAVLANLSPQGPGVLRPEAIATRLRADPGSCAQILRVLLADRAGPPLRLILVVDQFEELFTACRDEAERQAFVRALACAGAPPGAGGTPAAQIIIGVRSDFYGHCAAYPELVAALESGQVVVGPMTTAELREAIERPAERAGLSLEDGLTDLLLHDLRTDDSLGRDSGGILPLLSYALQATWQQREGRLLTLAGYQATGGIRDAVARTADRILNGLGEREQQAVRLLLLRMVRIGDGTEDTRQPVDLDELLAGRDQAEAEAVARARDALAHPDARLITLADRRAEITHEALLRAWYRLRRWIEEDRAGLLVHQHLADSARAWERAGRDRADLYTGSRLAGAARWAETDRHREQLSPLEAEFLDTSTRLADGQLAEARARARRLRRLAGGLALALVLAMTATGLAFVSRQNAITAQRAAVASGKQALSRQYAAQAAQIGSTDPRRSMSLALAAWRAGRTTEARSSLLSAPVWSNGYDGTLDGHTGFVKAVDISPDGKLIATGGFDDRTVRLWDAGDRHQIAELAHEDGAVYAVAFSPDGRLLASGSAVQRDGVRLWDVAGRREVARLPTGPVSSLAFSPDGRLLATGQGDNGVHLWDVARRGEVRSLTGNTSFVWSVAFGRDGLLAGGGQDHSVRVWNAATGEAVATLTDHGAQVTKVAFSPDGKTLASASYDGTIGLWDVTTRTARRPLTMNGVTVDGLAFSPDGSTLASSGDQYLRLWATAGWTLESTISGQYDVIDALAYGRDGNTLVTGGRGGSVVRWSFHRNAVAVSDQSFNAVTLRPGGRMVALARPDGSVQLQDATTRTPLRVLTGGSAALLDLAFSPDGRSLAAAGTDGNVRLWDPDTGEQLAVLPTGREWATRVAFSPDGTTLAALTSAGTDIGRNQKQALDPHNYALLRWDTRTRVAQAPLISNSASSPLLIGLAFSPDGGLLAFGDVNRVRLLDQHTGQELEPVATDRVTHVAFSPDGHTLAIATWDGGIRFWDATTRRQTGQLPAGNLPALWLAFSPDGSTLASDSADGVIRLWNVQDKRPTATLERYDSQPNELVFTADGSGLLASYKEGVALQWNLDPESAEQRLCRALSGRYLDELWGQLDPALGPVPC
ncbi:caspase, EACC1-associated type [Kitasatospora sp. NPDC094028]